MEGPYLLSPIAICDIFHLGSMLDKLYIKNAVLYTKFKSIITPNFLFMIFVQINEKLLIFHDHSTMANGQARSCKLIFGFSPLVLYVESLCASKVKRPFEAIKA